MIEKYEEKHEKLEQKLQSITKADNEKEDEPNK